MTKAEQDRLERDYFEKMKQLKEIAGSDIFDQELVHLNADKILCDMMTDLGHKDIVNLYYTIVKKRVE